MTEQQKAEWAGMLRDILERPDDDGARLRFADWCEDNGDHERAEFIWLQSKIARGGFCHYSRLDTCFNRRDNATEVGMTGCVKCAGLARRQHALLGDNVSNSPGEVEPRFFRWASPLHFPFLRVPGFTDTDCNSFGRGFVESVYMPLAAFTADDYRLPRLLFAEHPITAVTLTCREPHQRFSSPGTWHFSWASDHASFAEYFAPTPWCVPKTLMNKMRTGLASWHNLDFETPKLAHAALSWACVNVGRELVGLPELPRTLQNS